MGIYFKAQDVIQLQRGLSKLGGDRTGLVERYVMYPYRTKIGDEHGKQAKALFWNLEHFMRVIGDQLGDWTTVAEFSERIIPMDLFPARGSISSRFEACLFVAHDIVRPMSWLGLIDDGRRKQRPEVRLEERLIKKTALFDSYVRLIVPNADGGQQVH